MVLTKAEVARRQLGVALALYLEDHDPVSVHVLACSGAEIADELVKQAGKEPFSTHVLETFPELTPGRVRDLRNRYWNAFKHFRDRKGQLRDDEALFDRFSDEHNDHVLMLGWHDYALAVGRLPVEAQAHQVWYFAKHPDTLSPAVSRHVFEGAFPDIGTVPRPEQKHRLRVKIAQARTDFEVMNDTRTDPRALVLR